MALLKLMILFWLFVTLLLLILLLPNEAECEYAVWSMVPKC